MKKGEVRCQQRGEPEDGYDFFVCEECLAELEISIEVEYFWRLLRHINN